ncbi:MAG: hypothetical protein NVSMB21_20670 [Vulcanimicrobiaceae bacterium]
MRHTRTRYVLALAITGFVALVQFVILSDEILARRQQVAIVSLADDQRTLAVEIASLASAYVDASTDARPDLRVRLRTDIVALRRAQDELGDPTYAANPRGWPSAAVRQLFDGSPFDVAARTREYVRRAIRLIDAPERALERRNDDLIYLENVGSDLAYRYRAVVAAYVADGEAEQRTLLRNEALGLTALLLTLLLELPLIFRPMEAELERNVQRLLTEAHKLTDAERAARLGTWEIDVRGGAIEWSQELRRICGLEPAEPPPPLDSFDHPEDEAEIRLALAAARASRRPYRIDHRIRTRAGETRWVREQVRVVVDHDGRPKRLLGTAFDITDRRRAEEDLYRQAHHDALTGLPNRRLLRDRLVAAIAAAATSGRYVAVMYADLDRFKSVNDSLGHETGDLLLQATAARLLACVREEDTVARTGGDEFVIVIGGEDAAAALETAARIIAACEIAHRIGEVDLVAPLSIGIAVYPDDGTDADALMRAADTAMYRAKNEGGSRARATVGDDRNHYERLGLETELRHAIAHDELVVHYQPIVARDGETLGFEALVRWQHPRHGLLGPDRFIGIAEESGLIIGLGEWVLRTASADIEALQDRAHAVRLAVNVSSRQFRDPGFERSVATILRATGFDAGLLTLEITESVVMYDVERAIETMQALKASRVRISIDDFGTGYSSLAYLKRFPLDTLKIDRQFVRDLPEASDVAIVESIVTLAHNLGLRVVAEGVETEGQRALLVALSCDALQGYAIGRPMAAADLPAWLAAHRHTLLPAPCAR